MSSYPQDPKFEKTIDPGNGHDSVLVYLTKDDLVFVCAPYVDPPCFGPELAEQVCAAIKEAAEAAKK